MEYITNHITYYALHYNLTDPDTIINLILESQNNMDSYVAYRQLCLLHPIDITSRLDIKNRLNYSLIYLYTTQDRELNITINTDSIADIESNVIMIHSLCGLVDDHYYSVLGHSSTIAQSSLNIPACIVCDRINNEITIKNKIILDIVIERIKSLQSIPHYWNKIKQSYYNLIRRSTGIDSFISKEQIDTLNSYFDVSPIPPTSNKTKASFILNLKHDIQSYILGFDILNGSYNKQQIERRLNLYVDNEDDFWNEIRSHPIYKIQTVNEDDTLGEKWTSYAPFDITIYNDGNKSYAFTRPEWKWIIENGKNPWTKQDLSITFISYITFLTNYTIQREFPNPVIHKDLFLQQNNQSRLRFFDILMSI